MRIKRSTPDQQTLEQARANLGALADAGHQLVEIRTVMGWLGVTWRDPPGTRTLPDPQADPITGCKPVTAPDQI